MSAVEWLQQAGFNKYEAEAYVALALHGPLTGYEVGKRSQVPLSRSYEILERLTEKGWALVQPGDPPRYLALPPVATLDRLRVEQSDRLTELATALLSLTERPQPPGFWVVKGREAIVARMRSLIGEAQTRVELAVGADIRAALAPALTALGDGVVVVVVPPPGRDDTACVVCVDGHIMLAGSTAPAATCQALISTEPALIASLQAQFAPMHPTLVSASTEADWLTWEARKQQRLHQRPAS